MITTTVEWIYIKVGDTYCVILLDSETLQHYQLPYQTVVSQSLSLESC